MQKKDTEMKKITTKYQTIAIVGYRCSVSHNENRAAHGAVCLLQARRGPHGLLGRKINSNGRHQETGDSFPLDADTLAHWQRLV
jgi:hypothetical protein